MRGLRSLTGLPGSPLVLLLLLLLLDEGELRDREPKCDATWDSCCPNKPLRLCRREDISRSSGALLHDYRRICQLTCISGESHVE